MSNVEFFDESSEMSSSKQTVRGVSWLTGYKWVAGNVMTFRQGELVGVPCLVKRGPFPDENLVMVETEEGTIAGFVKQANLKVRDGERGVIKGTVVATERDHVIVRLFGSFFTTALGIASVRSNSLERLAAA